MNEDYWSSGAFEHAVEACLIACYESKPKKNPGAPPWDNLNLKRISVIRNEGPYIPSNSRVFLAPDPDENCFFDIDNDPLPVKGCFAGITGGIIKDQNPDSYLTVFNVRKVTSLGKSWYRRSGGALYEMLTMSAENRGHVAGERRFFTVDKAGAVKACGQRLITGKGYSPGRPTKIIEPSSDWVRETEQWASFALQALADRRFCWVISAREQIAKAHLGCMKEEVKSLLYARSLPLTATGRKRPILHLVEAHKRRMKSGIDIDVSSFLRGTQTVVIGNTEFKVNPPSILKGDITKNSVDRYMAVGE